MLSFQGSLSGIILTFLIMVSYVTLNNVYSSSLPDQKLPLSTAGCQNENTENYSTIILAGNNTAAHIANTNWKNEDDSLHIRFLSISYMWYSAAGSILSILMGLVCSLIINLFYGKPNVKVPSKCLSPPVLKLYKRYIPNHVQNWVDLTDKDKNSITRFTE